jgi:hypothetical protein
VCLAWSTRSSWTPRGSGPRTLCAHTHPGRRQTPAHPPSSRNARRRTLSPRRAHLEQALHSLSVTACVHTTNNGGCLATDCCGRDRCCRVPPSFQPVSMHVARRSVLVPVQCTRNATQLGLGRGGGGGVTQTTPPLTVRTASWGLLGGLVGGDCGFSKVTDGGDGSGGRLGGREGALARRLQEQAVGAQHDADLQCGPTTPAP